MHTLASVFNSTLQVVMQYAIVSFPIKRTPIGITPINPNILFLIFNSFTPLIEFWLKEGFFIHQLFNL